MRARRTDERQGDPRVAHSQRVMSALMHASDNTLGRREIRLVCGLTDEQAIAALGRLVRLHAIEALGDSRYRITRRSD